METKKEIRKSVLKMRKALLPEIRKEKCSMITRRVIQHELFEKADVVLSYADYNGEVYTEGIVNQAIIDGKIVGMPRVNGDTMEFYQVVSKNDLESGCMGILEPKKTCLSLEYISAEKNVLVIMPGAVFDEECHRIGYGGGFYDKYLSVHSDYNTIALAFDLQILSKVPFEDFDIKPQIIITETMVYE